MRIGFIGLGNVGGKLAASLQRNGFDLVVYDLDRTAAQSLVDNGGLFADSARQLAATTDIVITCLPSPQAVADVMESDDGILRGMRPGQIWMEMSTTDATEVRRLGERVGKLGASTLDAPVSGGCHRAATGNISILVGGDRSAFATALPALIAMGRRILHTGPLGSASVLKVVTNYLCSVHLVALGEALTVAKQAGLDLNMAFEAIRISSGNSFVHETESQVILNGSYNIGFTMDLVLKDMGLFDELARRHNVPLELSPLILEIFEDGSERFGPRAWSSMIVRRLEDACGVELRAPGFPAELVDTEEEQAGSEVLVPGGTTD